MISDLRPYNYYPVQTSGWNITYAGAEYTLIECYNDCLNKGCQMFYHTNVKKCWMFEHQIPSYHKYVEELPRQEITNPDEHVLIYFLRP